MTLSLVKKWTMPNKSTYHVSGSVNTHVNPALGSGAPLLRHPRPEGRHDPRARYSEEAFFGAKWFVSRHFFRLLLPQFCLPYTHHFVQGGTW